MKGDIVIAMVNCSSAELYDGDGCGIIIKATTSRLLESVYRSAVNRVGSFVQLNS